MMNKLQLIYCIFIIIVFNNYALFGQTYKIDMNKEVYKKYYGVQSQKFYYNFIYQQKGEYPDKLKAGDAEIEGVKFMLALQDVSRNGIYNEKNYGANLSLGEYGADSIIANIHSLPNVVSFTEIPDRNIIIQVEDKFFEVLEVDSKGEYIIIKTLPATSGLKPDIRKLEVLFVPTEFELLDRQIANLFDYKNKGKYLYIEFWGLWCAPCVEATDSLKQVYELYNDRLEIIALNERDDHDKVRQYILDKEIKWVNGLSNKEISTNLLQNGYPYGILFDENGNLIKQFLHPVSLRKYLETHIFKRE